MVLLPACLRILAAALLFAVPLSGCALPPFPTHRPQEPPEPPDPQSPTIRNDPYSPTLKVVTEPGTHRNNLGREHHSLDAMVSRNDGSAIAYVELEVHRTRSAWASALPPLRASNDRAQNYRVVEAPPSWYCGRPDECDVRQLYRIQIPFADLKRGATEGIRFKVYGLSSNKDRIIEIPASLIVQFNEKLAEARKLAAQKR